MRLYAHHMHIHGFKDGKVRKSLEFELGSRSTCRTCNCRGAKSFEKRSGTALRQSQTWICMRLVARVTVREVRHQRRGLAVSVSLWPQDEYFEQIGMIMS